jgi:hypothetical protein
MTRRSSLGLRSLQIHREFAPSRCQLRVLALAFEQVLPLIRRPLAISPNQQIVVNSDSNSFVRSSSSGALR